FTYFISLQHFTRLCSCFFFMLPPPPRSTLFPYTTLFRSIGALFAGFLAGYLMVGIRKLCDHLPSALEGIKPTLIYPVLGVLLMGAIMCAVNPFFAMLNNALTNGLNSMGGSSKILLGCILGGMMSIDMGGPFNKAAYVFGTAAISNGDYDIMAAVMIGGMVPP